MRDLRPEPGARRASPEAFAALSLLTSFETFYELRRHVGLPKREVVRQLQDAARRLVLADS